jgi:hypothetical protein
MSRRRCNFCKNKTPIIKNGVNYRIISNKFFITVLGKFCCIENFERPLKFNFCPMCGIDLNKEEKEKIEKRKEREEKENERRSKDN